MASLTSTIPSTSLPSSASSPPVQSRVLETSSMILSWLRSAVPSILSNAGHKPRRAKREHPIDALTAILSDAVVLADFVSFLDPIRLPPSAIMRASSRNAMSTPVPTPNKPTNIDSRQLQVQYKNNTRRVVAALKKIIVDVRAFLNVPHTPPPAAVDVFVGDVAALSPAKDIRPAIKLAQLAIACAVYGPRHNEFRHCIWQFATEPIRAAFHSSMISVSQAVALPPPDILYQPTTSPLPQLPTPHLIPAQALSPRPPISPLPLSPHMSPHHILSPVINPIPTAASTAPLANLLSPPPQPMRQYAATPPPLPPTVLPSNVRSPPVYPKPLVASSPRATLTASSKTTPKHPAARMSPRPPKKKTMSSKRSFVKPLAAGTAAAAVGAAAGAAAVLVAEKRVANRQLSMVTNDESKSEKNSPPKAASVHDALDLDDSIKKVKSYRLESGTDTDGDDGDSTVDLRRFESAITTTSEDRGMYTKSSGGFFSPSPSGRESPAPIAKETKPSVVLPPPSELFSEAKVDENVRQSVTSSIARQISHGGNFGRTQSSKPQTSAAAATSSSVAPKLFRSSSNTSTVDFNDPRYMYSPAVSDAPSPSNQWQMPRQKINAQEILSPMQLYSPPQMPARLSRSSAGTQVTPPTTAPQLFRPGTVSPSLTVSSTGGYSITESERSTQNRSSARNADGGRTSRTSSSRRKFSLPPSAAATKERRSPAVEKQTIDEIQPAAPVVVKERQTEQSPFVKEDEPEAAPAQKEIEYTTGSDSAEQETSPHHEEEEFVPYAPEKEERSEGLNEEPQGSSGQAIQVDSDAHDDDAGEQYEDDNIVEDATEDVEAPHITLGEDISATTVEESKVDAEEDSHRDQSEYLKPSSYRASPRFASPLMPGFRSSYTYGRDVPQTPPTPPPIDSLLRTVSGHTPSTASPRPVSTMEPSAQLFRKLMSVWQTPEDERPLNLSETRNFQDEVPTPRTPPSGFVASALTAESSAATRDATVEEQKEPESLQSPRGRRPRAVRLPAEYIASSSTGGGQIDDNPSSFGDIFSADKVLEEGMADDSAAGRSSFASKGASSSHSTSTTRNGIIDSDGQHVKVDPRRLDWLTRQLIVARNANSRKDLRLALAETERLEKEELLLLEKQDAESVVVGMKRILQEREVELHDARTRLSMAIEGVARDRSSQESKTSAGGQPDDLGQLIRDKHEKLHERLDEADKSKKDSNQALGDEMRGLWTEVKKAMIEKMIEMTEKRDAELELLRTELQNRERLVRDLQKNSADLMNQNREYQSETANMRVEKEKSSHRYELEMSHVSAQVELVNEFSKKLHDNFRETENLRQQVLHYQDKLSNITSTSGVSQRQIKELREAVTRANDECARLRREADIANRRGMEAVRRAEELEQLRLKDDASAGRYPDRQDRTESGSFRSHEPVRPAGHNRPSGAGTTSRYAARTRAAQPTPAQKAWLAIKDKIGGIVTGKDMGSSRRKGHGTRRDHSRHGAGSQSSHSSRSRASPHDALRGSRTNSIRSRSSNGSIVSGHSGAPSNRSGSFRNGEEMNPFAKGTPYGGGEVGRIRAGDFA